jgi:hypothetical protein
VYQLRPPFLEHPQMTGLPFLSQLIGLILGTVLIGPLGRLFAKVQFSQIINISQTSPEAKLIIAVPAAALITISTFWWAWTSGPEIHYMVSVASGVPFGISVIITFGMSSTPGCASQRLPGVCKQSRSLDMIWTATRSTGRRPTERSR